MEIILPTSSGKKRNFELAKFAQALQKFGEQTGIKISSRGWCYQLESERLINKNEFDKAEKIINECRKKGFLPIDFVAEEDARAFSGIETPDSRTPIEYMKEYLEAALRCEKWYTPDWWKGEEYYIQMLVEKIDLKTLFKTVCEKYHIPIATSKGWSSMLQRAEYARRFREAEDMGLKCVLLYCGDHDPDGLRISDFIRKNLSDLKSVVWRDGEYGYDPSDLVIDRFGLNYEDIAKLNLTWIDNLITGSGKNLASPSHKNYHMDYVQDYLSRFGVRKCEANAIVPKPKEARAICRMAIENYLGPDALDRFDVVRKKIVRNVDDFRRETGLEYAITKALEIIGNQR